MILPHISALNRQSISSRTFKTMFTSHSKNAVFCHICYEAVVIGLLRHVQTTLPQTMHPTVIHVANHLSIMLIGSHNGHVC